MPLLDAAHNYMLDSAADDKLTTAALSLHSAYSATGGNEVTGGSPAYARKNAAWAAAASGEKALSADVAFDVPATDVAWLGVWTNDVTPVFWGMQPLLDAASTATPQVATVTDITGNVIDAPAHGFSNGQTVVLFPLAEEALPGGVTAGTIYFVVGATTDTLQISTTEGGAAVDLTSTGVALIQRITKETFAAQGTYTVKAATKLEL